MAMPSSSLYRFVRLPRRDQFIQNMPRIRSDQCLSPPSTYRPRPCLPLRRLLSFLLLLVIAILLFCFSQRIGAMHYNLAFPKKPPAYLVESSKTFVVSLPRREDRHAEMEHLRNVLDLDLEYVAAIDSSDNRITAILQQVRAVRMQYPNNQTVPDTNSTRFPFKWPSNIDSLALSNTSLHTAQRSFWDVPVSDGLDNSPVLVAQRDFTVASFYSDVSEYKILTPARIACWDSHLSVIKRIAHSQEHDVGFVIEDDVDMERDIRERLGRVWSTLPQDWDMVFLGHCWSDEAYYPAIASPESGSALHPSRSPKCTHAYALSRTGARRLFLHLVHPPFAYSRAIDQAFAWLIRSHRVKSYSLVPSVVIQRKIGGSDVSSGKGSRWRDELVNGVFAP